MVKLVAGLVQALLQNEHTYIILQGPLKTIQVRGKLQQCAV